MKTFKRIHLIFVLICLLISLPQLSIGQQKDLDSYPVKPVYAPPLKRPSVDVNREKLPKEASGRLPSWDGEFFQLNLKPEKAEPSDENARKLLNVLLDVINWQQNREDLKSVQPVSRPLSKDDQLEKDIKEAEEKTRQELIGRFGKINQATEEAIQEQVELARQQAGQEIKIFPFDQYYQEIPIENTSIRVVWRSDEGFTAITGRVFDKIDIGNSRVLTAAQAKDAAEEYVQKYTKLSEEITSEPRLVLLPYGETFLFAWKMDVYAVEGPYRIWIDAESGKVLQLLPQFFSDDALGLVFDPDPNGGTEEKAFEVDPPSGGQYYLKQSGVLDVDNDGSDGVCSGDLTIADDGSGTANFNVSPINGTVVDRVGSTNYNCRFQDVNAYAWIYNHIKTFVDVLGSSSIPALAVTVNASYNNAYAYPTTNALKFGIGNATTGTSTSCDDVFNSAVDATVVTHEFGHIVNHHNYGGTMSRNINEGLADFWACSMFDTDTFGAFWGGNCAAPSQGGWVPRRAEAQDVFPEHRALSTSAYGDGQIVCWGLWNVRREFNESSALGTFLINSNLLDAMATANSSGVSTDQQVHDTFLNLLEQLAPLFSSSRNIHKVLSGFARAGIFLSERDAVIDIDDDYLDRDDANGPTFTIWTGRDYTFNADGSANTTAAPYNTRFEIEVANDASFTTNLISSGVLSGVVAGAGGTATWTLPTADWNTVKAQDRLYYRVRTTDDTGGNIRTSENPGNDFPTGVPLGYTVINESGECECTCSVAAASSRRHIAMITLVPVFIAIVWRRRLKAKEKDSASSGR